MGVMSLLLSGSHEVLLPLKLREVAFVLGVVPFCEHIGAVFGLGAFGTASCILLIMGLILTVVTRGKEFDRFSVFGCVAVNCGSSPLPFIFLFGPLGEIGIVGGFLIFNISSTVLLKRRFL